MDKRAERQQQAIANLADLLPLPTEENLKIVHRFFNANASANKALQANFPGIDLVDSDVNGQFATN